MKASLHHFLRQLGLLPVPVPVPVSRPVDAAPRREPQNRAAWRDCQ